MKAKRKTIEEIAAELRGSASLGLLGEFLKDLANQIEAAYCEGVLKAIDEIKADIKAAPRRKRSIKQGKARKA